MFKLTEEQIEEILSEYGGSRQLINTLERKLNLIGVIDEEEDYFEIIASIAAQKETVKFDTERYNRREDKENVFMSIDEIIENELNRKYNNFEDANPAIQAKFNDYQRRK